MIPKIAVVIPSIPIRNEQLSTALSSAVNQTIRPTAICVYTDHDINGASITRNTALSMVPDDCEWTAFLDDDDELLPDHCEQLYNCALETSADIVYSWYYYVDENGIVLDYDPVCPESRFSEVYDDSKPPKQTTVTFLVKTKLAKEIGFLDNYQEFIIDGLKTGEEHDFIHRCWENGAKIVHLPKRTWYYHHDSISTNGKPDRWVRWRNKNDDTYQQKEAKRASIPRKPTH